MGYQVSAKPWLEHDFAGVLREELVPLEEPDEKNKGERKRGKGEEGETEVGKAKTNRFSSLS